MTELPPVPGAQAALLRPTSRSASMKIKPPKVHDMTAVLSRQRAEEPNGLWATKQYGDLLEGDAVRAPGYITGSVEFRQLRHMVKLSFLDIKLIYRRKQDAALSSASTHSGDSDDAPSSQAQQWELEAQGLPVLYVFLTKKTPKPRMADLERSALLLRLEVGVDGRICTGAARGNFEQSLSGVPDPLGYVGVVMVKRMADAPQSEEPLVYAYCKLVQQRRPLPPTDVALGLADEADRVKRYDKPKLAKRNTDLLIKNIRMYARTAKKAWEALGRAEDNEIDFEEFKRAFDEMNIMIIESRAMRLFKSSDLDGSGSCGITEFEIALMMNDAAPPTKYLTPLDSFYVFDLDGGGTISWVEFKESVSVLSSKEFTEAELRQIFKDADSRHKGEIDYEQYKQVWLRLVDLDLELKRRGLKPCVGLMAVRRNKRQLIRAIEQEDKQVITAFEQVRGRVDDMRRAARIKRDERRARKAAQGGKYSLEDAKEAANRRKQRRIMLMKEQKERSKQRTEAKVQANLLLQEQAAKQVRDKASAVRLMHQRAQDRVRDIREKGHDVIDLRAKGLREVPEECVTGKEWRGRLGDAVLLDLSHNKISKLPKADFLYHMGSLRKLDLSDNRLEGLPALEVAGLHSLQILHLERNELRSLPEEIGHCAALEHLHLSRNNLKDLPAGLGGLVNLRSLVAHANCLEVLPATLGQLAKLEVCDLSLNSLSELPNSLGGLCSLTALDLSGNQLKRLPLDLGQLYCLTSLDLSHNALTMLPASIAHLNTLQVLRVRENELTEISHAWHGLTALVEADLASNQIAHVSSSIGAAKTLQLLDLTHNKIETLPPEIGLLTDLQLLSLRSNLLASVPDELGALSSLHRLDVSHNRLRNRPTEHLGLLTGLLELDLSNNGMMGIPPSLGALSRLESLHLGSNALQELPKSMSYLGALGSLDLSCNRLASLPEFVCAMTSLRKLDLQGNVLRRLPSEVSALTFLTQLRLGNNLLEVLPLEFGALEDAVVDLDIGGNPFGLLPPKWGDKLTPQQRHAQASGYSQGEVLEWLRVQNAFHRQACEEWDAMAGLYVTNRASLQQFTDRVRLRVGDAWRPYMQPHLDRFFFSCKETGTTPSYQQETLEDISHRAHVTSVLAARKQKQFSRFQQQNEELRQRARMLYDVDMAHMASTKASQSRAPAVPQTLRQAIHYAEQDSHMAALHKEAERLAVLAAI